MILQRLKGTDWRYSFTEIVLIFVGISLALFVDNWNEERKEHILEAELLGALRSDLIETDGNLWAPIHKTEMALYSQKKLLELLDSSESPPSSLEIYETFFNDSTLLVASGAYESLKNVGLDLVSDRELRKLITRFYEGQLQSLGDREEILRQRLLLAAWPYFLDKFGPAGGDDLVWDDFSYGQVPSYKTISPIDWEEMKNDSKLKLLMIDLYQRRQSLLWDYTILERDIDTLLALLPEVNQES